MYLEPKRTKLTSVTDMDEDKHFATTVRDGVFAPTPSALSVRGFFCCNAAWFDVQVETGDSSVCFHASRLIF